MKKLWTALYLGIITWILVNMLSSCHEKEEWEQANITESITNVRYFKDSTTGLCFGYVSSATYGGRAAVSITCVPCDSIKHLNLNK